MVESTCFDIQAVNEIIADERYIIDDYLGEGGMACVYLAREKGSSIRYALKLLKEQYRQRQAFLDFFKGEADNMRDLQHPNVVRFYKFVAEKDSAYILMEYVEGSPLTVYIRRAIENRQPFPLSEIVRIMVQVAWAISHLHKEGFIHRDVKPGNVLLRHSDGKVVLTDFGITGAQNADFALSGAGTPSYMPTEQQEGTVRTDHTIDIYALAIMLFEMFAGEKPFRVGGGLPYEEARAQLLELHKSAPIPHVTNFRPELPETLNAVFEKALAKQPQDRYQDVIAFAKDIHEILLPLLDDDLKDFQEIQAKVIPTSEGIKERKAREEQRLSLEKRQQNLLRFGIAGIIGLIVIFSLVFYVTVLTPQPTLTPSPTLEESAEAVVEVTEAITPAVEPSATLTTPPTDTPIPATDELPATESAEGEAPIQESTIEAYSLVSERDAIYLLPSSDSLNELLARAIRINAPLLPLAVGDDVQEFSVSIDWENIEELATYGIAFHIQPDDSFKLFYIDIEASEWRIEERSSFDAEDATIEIIAAGELDSPYPTSITMSIRDSEILIQGDSETLASTDSEEEATGSIALWVNAPDNIEEGGYPQIDNLSVNLEGQDAERARANSPTPLPTFEPLDDFMTNAMLLSNLVRTINDVPCTRFSILFERLETEFEANGEAYQLDADILDNLEPVIDAGQIIDQLCSDGDILDYDEDDGDIRNFRNAVNAFITFIDDYSPESE